MPTRALFRFLLEWIVFIKMKIKYLVGILLTIQTILLFGCSRLEKMPIQVTATQSAISSSTGPISSSSSPLEQPQLKNTVPSATITPVPTSRQVDPTLNPTYLNFPTVTPTATIDLGQIPLHIVSPGPMSKLVSPLEFVVQIAPYYAGSTRIELIGEDGIELFRKVFRTYSNIGYFTRIDEKINFEIQGAAEIARLQVSTFDVFGRVQAFNSVRVLLQAVGENEFTPIPEAQDRLLLRFPLANDEIDGSSLAVSGEYLPANDQPVILELIDEKGAVIGSRILQLDSASGGYQQFSSNIPFQIDKKTSARLIIRQSDDRINGLVFADSRLLTLIPK